LHVNAGVFKIITLTLFYSGEHYGLE
jgi:hypothetical protein